MFDLLLYLFDLFIDCLFRLRLGEVNKAVKFLCNDSFQSVSQPAMDITVERLFMDFLVGCTKAGYKILRELTKANLSMIYQNGSI